jgi:DNA primase
MKIPYPVPEEILEMIKKNVLIMDIIKDMGIKYWKAGVGKYKIRSFRNFDKDPSLIIYDNKNDFYDFSAGIGGDVIQFYMEATGCDFRQAVKELAEMCFSGDFEHEKSNLKYKVRLNDYNLAIEEFNDLLQFIMSCKSKSKTKHLKFVREMIKEVKNKIAREELAEADNQAEKV